MRNSFLAALFLMNSMVSDHVICIHGFLPTPFSMNKMHNGLWSKGYYSHVYKYPSTKYTIATQGVRLNTYLQKLARKYPGERFHFVAHSMGGLVLRAAMNHESFPEEMRNGKAVLIGTPNKGSYLARQLGTYLLPRLVMGDNAGKELRKYTEKNIVQLGQFPDGYPVLVIAGTKGMNPLLDGVSDGTVLVEETRLETEHAFYTVHARHPFMVGHPQVIEKTYQYFKEP